MRVQYQFAESAVRNKHNCYLPQLSFLDSFTIFVVSNSFSGVSFCFNPDIICLLLLLYCLFKGDSLPVLSLFLIKKLCVFGYNLESGSR